jgi:glutathione S-transferase
MSELVLHHYNESPYAEKIRTLLGYKGLTWRSVIVPRIAPKPDLTALTGGYRKVPVLQIGADVYCDTRLIAEVIAAAAPEPSTQTLPGAFTDVVEHWVDSNLFARAVAFTFGSLVDYLPDELLADRAALRGAPLEREALKRAVPLAAQELATQLRWVETGLAGGQLFVNGERPGAGDFTLYSTLWFARNGRFDFSAFPLISAWMGRMQAFGHGERIDMTAQEALTLAAASEPIALTADSVSPDACGVAQGNAVSVTPESLGHGTTVTGELVAINDRRLTLRLKSERCGTVHVHFPRVGYRVRVAELAASQA